MDYDLAIIGAGWAGFNAAQRAKQLGLKVCLIEKGRIGGTCLNVGCIPTKTLIQSAKVYTLTKKAPAFGVDVADARINILKIQERKDKIIQDLRQGMQFLLKGIDYRNGQAKILSPEELKVVGEVIRTRFILIATGAKPMELSEIKFEAKKIISSDEILNLKEIPQTLLIIGGGVIGCEFASLFSTLGSEVSIIEKMPQLLPGLDSEIARKLETVFKKKKIKVNTNTDAKSSDLKSYDLVLLCVGRTPQIADLDLGGIGLRLEKNRITTDEYLKTNIPNIYAAGDCTAKIMLAHNAAYQGRVAAENVVCTAGPKKVITDNVVNCIFTDPEIAAIGLSEEEAKNKNIEVRMDRFDFRASGAARILEETDGFMKIISDRKTEQILGASLIGPRATELIGILTLAISSSLKISQVQNTVFAHPTLSECISDAFKHYSI